MDPDKTYSTPTGWHDRCSEDPNINSLLEYNEIYRESIRNPETFWAQQARDLLSFSHDFHTTHTGSFEHGDNAWFLGGEINASSNCIDRHCFRNPECVAIIYETDEPSDGTCTITYGDLLREVSRLAWFLRTRGIRKGDIVTIYMPMIPETVYTLLACARIGAVHSVVFAGFSAEALRDRILDAKSRVVLTADEGLRGGKTIRIKEIVDQALRDCPDVSTVLTYQRTGNDVPWTPVRDLWWHEELEKFPAYIPPEPMNSEDFLFLLYTSGSTGKPKGIFHSTAGYLLGAVMTGKYVFDIHQEDRFFCAGDIGWITGHTYVVYSPLLLGCATVVFESTPVYPSCLRYWNVMEKYGVTQFYAAPTALRLLKRATTEIQTIDFDLSHLRVLGSVGEPIAPEVWKWYYEFMGQERAFVTDVGGCSIHSFDIKDFLSIVVLTEL